MNNIENENCGLQLLDLEDLSEVKGGFSTKEIAAAGASGVALILGIGIVYYLAKHFNKKNKIKLDNNPFKKNDNIIDLKEQPVINNNEENPKKNDVINDIIEENDN